MWKRPKRPWKVWTLQVMEGGGEDFRWQERSNTFLPLGIQFPARQSDLGDIKRGIKRGEA